MTLLLHPTSTGLWHEIIHEAEAACTVTLKEEVEAYLVFLLARYVNRPDFVKDIVAHEFMEGMQASHHKRALAMQEVGDKCLLFSGLFPHLAERRLVKISYFVNMGQASYEAISKKKTDLYGSLARQFVTLMDVLQSIRRYSKEITDLLPIESFELWSETGSKRSLEIFSHFTTATPIKTHKEGRH